jgi:hypothetical protein
MIKLLIIILLLGCSSTQERIIEVVPEQPNIQPIIEEVKQNEPLKQNPILQAKIKKALDDCDAYGDMMKQKFNDCIDLSNKQSSLIAKYKQDVLQLEEELRFWRKVKLGIYAFCFAVLFGLLVKFLMPIILGLTKRSVGL